MPYFSKDEIARAREVDLLTYLQCCEPDELVHVGGNVYSTRTHDSLKISNGKWCWWSRGIGGRTALDYLTRICHMTFTDAVAAITGMTRVSTAYAQKPQPPPAFSLPPRHADNRRVFSYLYRRGIDPEIIKHCIKRGQLYEDAEHHNCVFVGFEGDVPRYAALRGTHSQSTFVGDVAGSDKRFSFAVPVRASGNCTLCVFESAVDALSYLTLIKMQRRDWRGANVLSLAGVYQPRRSGKMKFPRALEQYLTDNPQIKRIILCLDNDEPGRIASETIRQRLTDYTVVNNPPRRGKDYNELLQIAKGISGRVKTRGGDAR